MVLMEHKVHKVNEVHLELLNLMTLIHIQLLKMVINTQATFSAGQAICDQGDFVVNGGFIINVLTGGPEGIYEDLNRPILLPFAAG